MQEATQVLGFPQDFVRRVRAEFPDQVLYQRLHRDLVCNRRQDVMRFLQQQQTAHISPQVISNAIEQAHENGLDALKALKEEADRLCRIKALFQEVLKMTF